MLGKWIPPESLAALNEGFVVAIMLEAKEGESEARKSWCRRFNPVPAHHFFRCFPAIQFSET